jgi:hypothetical protein
LAVSSKAKNNKQYLPMGRFLKTSFLVVCLKRAILNLA